MVVRSALTHDTARDAAESLVAIVTTEGSARHPHLVSLGSLDSAVTTRNASDALHHLSMLHGRHPGVLDHAAARTTMDKARSALFALADRFMLEREYLGRLVVAAGPIPSTPGQAETEASVIHQRHAIEMLSQSDRQGCAVGAALAVALDWQSFGSLLAASGRRFGVDAVPPPAIDSRELADIARIACGTPATDRAMLFGAQQIAVQHRGLWDLLEARATARGPH